MIRIVIVLLCLANLSACGSFPAKKTDTPVITAESALLSQVRKNLSGLYGNYAQHWLADDEDASNEIVQHWRLSVVMLPGPAGEAWFSLMQYPASDADSGQTSILRFSLRGDQLVLQFAPWQQSTDPWSLPTEQISAASRFLPGCEVRLLELSGQLAGQTNPTICKSRGPDGRKITLTKDFAFTGAAINIGERISDSDSGAIIGGDNVFRFEQMLQFRGWAGIKPKGTSEWQLARPLEIWSDGGTAQLVDVAGDPLGYSIRLAQVPWRTDQTAILRLDLTDDATGEITAYSWADPASPSLGLNLGWIQVGLTQILP